MGIEDRKPSEREGNTMRKVDEIVNEFDGVLEVLKRELLDVKLAEALDDLAAAMGGPRLYAQAQAAAAEIKANVARHVAEVKANTRRPRPTGLKAMSYHVPGIGRIETKAIDAGSLEGRDTYAG